MVYMGFQIRTVEKGGEGSKAESWFRHIMLSLGSSL